MTLRAPRGESAPRDGFDGGGGDPPPGSLAITHRNDYEPLWMPRETRTNEHGEPYESTPSPKICYCMEVYEAEIVRAIRAGATSLTEIMDRTRAGTGCGTCRSELLALLARERNR